MSVRLLLFCSSMVSVNVIVLPVQRCGKYTVVKGWQLCTVPFTTHS